MKKEKAEEAVRKWAAWAKHQAMHHYIKGHSNRSDLLQEAMLALWIAALKCRNEKALPALAKKYIHYACRKWSMDNQRRTLAITPRTVEDARRLRYAEELAASHGFSDKDRELLERILDWPPTRLQKARSISARTVLYAGLITPELEEGRSIWGAVEYGNPEKEAVIKEKRELVRQAVQELDEPYCSIIERYFGLYGPRFSLVELAKLFPGRGKDWVHRKLKKALGQLRFVLRRQARWLL